MIALIDYGSGNLRSVSKALEHEGAQVTLVDRPEGLRQASSVVLQGVGLQVLRNFIQQNPS